MSPASVMGDHGGNVNESARRIFVIPHLRTRHVTRPPPVRAAHDADPAIPLPPVVGPVATRPPHVRLITERAHAPPRGAARRGVETLTFLVVRANSHVQHARSGDGCQEARGVPGALVYDKLVHLSLLVSPPRTVPGGGATPCKGEADDAGMQRDEAALPAGEGADRVRPPSGGRAAPVMPWDASSSPMRVRQAPTCRRAIAPSSPRWAGLTERSGSKAFTAPMT